MAKGQLFRALQANAGKGAKGNLSAMLDEKSEEEKEASFNPFNRGMRRWEVTGKMSDINPPKDIELPKEKKKK